MSDIAIKIENLSKKYFLGTTPSGNLRDSIAYRWNCLMGNEERIEQKEFWALKEVSFEVKKGEVIGIIGRNGAGKSTLLKILSRITEPTSGRVELNGRVASLLEVGTGFHPELSGRENIFLNGALLGMTRAEIKQKFDEIIDFSGVEEFIDTPVKKYSSGMYVRLAFAVAAHLEPEILLIDEVLAVGDVEFQKKCLGKMDEVAKGGRTVVFVSHNLDVLKNICTSGIYLQKGMCNFQKKSIENAIANYINPEILGTLKGRFYANSDKNLEIEFIEASILNSQKQINTIFKTNQEIFLLLKYQVNKNLKGVVVNFKIETNKFNNPLFISFDTDLDTNKLQNRETGKYSSLIQIPSKILKPGYYNVSINAGIANVTTIQEYTNCLTFSVQLSNEKDEYISYSQRRPGIIAMPLQWKTESII